MNPGKGYKYFSNNASSQTLLYPATSPVVNPTAVLRSAGLKWTADRHRYPNNMTLTYVVENGDWRSEQIEIGAFCGDECRGSVMVSYVPQITEHPYLGFLVISGEGNEEIYLKAYDHAANKEYGVENRFSFTSDAILGSPATPYRVVVSTTGTPDLQSGSVAVFLDSSGENLIVRHPWDVIDRLEIVDLNGRIVWQETGFASQSVNVSALAKGMYMLRLVKENQVFVRKFVK